MKYPKTLNLLIIEVIQPCRFITKKWVEIKVTWNVFHQ